MLVDEYEQYHNNNDRTDVVVVSRSGSEEPDPEILADDRKSLQHPLHYFRHDCTFIHPADPATEGSESRYTSHKRPKLLYLPLVIDI